MAITVLDQGVNNKLLIDPKILDSGMGKIIFVGDNNTLSVSSPVFIFGGHFELRDGATVTIGAWVHTRNLVVYATRATVVRIGVKVGFNGIVRLQLHEPGNITIGDECLFASDTDVTISDMHSIIDVETGQRINPPKDVVIGRHVWVGQQCLILKGAEIGDDSVIGARSLVSGAVPPNCLAVGSPVRVVKEKITWDQRLL